MSKAAKQKHEPGKPVKLSREVIRHLESVRSGKESYDATLRRNFGLPAKNGYSQPLREYFVLDTPAQLLIRRDKAEARGEAILLAVKRGQSHADKQKKDEVITVRELP